MIGIYTDNNKEVITISPSSEALKIMSIDEIIMKDSPQGVSPIIMDESKLPQYEIFRNAWVLNNKKIKIDINKAKEKCHEIRRKKRNELFKPLDIEATIPFKAKEAEAKRQIIRNKDNKIQVRINNSKNENDLKKIIKKLEI